MIRRLFTGLCMATGIALVVLARVAMAKQPLKEDPPPDFEPELLTPEEAAELREATAFFVAVPAPEVVIGKDEPWPEFNMPAPEGWQ